MRIEVSKKHDLKKELLKKTPCLKDIKTVFEPPTTLSEDGKVIAMAINSESVPEYEMLFHQVIKRIDFSESTRTNGLKTKNKIFGWQPPNFARRRWSSNLAAVHRELPGSFDIIQGAINVVDSVYHSAWTLKYVEHLNQAQKVRSEYLLGHSVFTSGIINENVPLKYHFDSGNFENVVSAMLCFSKGLEGGELLFPDYEVGLKMRNNALYLFDGQSILHGVAPFQITPGGYRYTVVFYSLEDLKKALSPVEELKKAKLQEWSQFK